MQNLTLTALQSASWVQDSADMLQLVRGLCDLLNSAPSTGTIKCGSQTFSAAQLRQTVSHEHVASRC